MKKYVALFALLLGGCASANATYTRLPDGKIVASVSTADERLTIATASSSTFVCSQRKGCEHIATGGGVTNGAAGIVGPLVQGTVASAIARGAAGTSINNAPVTIASAKSKSGAKSTGAGSSSTRVNVGVTNTAIGTGGTASATNTNNN